MQHLTPYSILMGVLGTMMWNFENGSFAIRSFVGSEYIQPATPLKIGTEENRRIADLD